MRLINEVSESPKLTSKEKMVGQKRLSRPKKHMGGSGDMVERFPEYS